MIHLARKVELAPGYDISRLIHGGWQNQQADLKASLRSLHAHADAGISAFETSDTYRGGEELLGAFLKERLPNGENPLHLHTRFSVNNQTPQLSKTNVSTAIDRSLSRLGVEKIDLLQLQWWRTETDQLIDTAGWLSDLRDQGKIRHLGVTNFTLQMLADVCASGAVIISHQVQCSLLDRRIAGGMADYCVKRNIALLGYGPLAGGFLTSAWRGARDPKTEAAEYSREYRLMIELFGGWELYQALLSVLGGIAVKHDVEIATLAARLALDQPVVEAILLGASNARNLSANLALFDIQPDEADRSAIEAVLARAKAPGGGTGELERDLNGPFHNLIRSTRQPG